MYFRGKYHKIFPGFATFGGSGLRIFFGDLCGVPLAPQTTGHHGRRRSRGCQRGSNIPRMSKSKYQKTKLPIAAAVSWLDAVLFQLQLGTNLTAFRVACLKVGKWGCPSSWQPASSGHLCGAATVVHIYYGTLRDRTQLWSKIDGFIWTKTVTVGGILGVAQWNFERLVLK